MPNTPNFGITYPCMSPAISVNDFQAYATSVETAIATVDTEATATTHLPYAIQVTSTTPAVGVATTLVFVASAFNLSSGVTVAANTFTIITPGLYDVIAQTGPFDSTLTLTSARTSILKNAVLVNAIKRKPSVAFPSAGNMNITAALDCAVGDAITFQYLWTGTGAAVNPLAAQVTIQLLSTP